MRVLALVLILAAFCVLGWFAEDIIARVRPRSEKEED